MSQPIKKIKESTKLSKPAKTSSPSSRKVVSKKIKSRIKPKNVEGKSELEKMFEKMKNRKL